MLNVVRRERKEVEIRNPETNNGNTKILDICEKMKGDGFCGF